jgi:hypothetical protein
MAATSFGKDISCTDSLRTGRYATGARLVAESAYRRLITPRGMLRGGEDEQNFGFDISQLIGTSKAKNDAATVLGRIRAELLKDERIGTVEVSLVESKNGPETTYAITIAAKTTEGPFTLAIGVSDLSVELLGIEEES